MHAGSLGTRSMQYTVSKQASTCVHVWEYACQTLPIGLQDLRIPAILALSPVTLLGQAQQLPIMVCACLHSAETPLKMHLLRKICILPGQAKNEHCRSTTPINVRSRQPETHFMVCSHMPREHSENMHIAGCDNYHKTQALQQKGSRVSHSLNFVIYKVRLERAEPGRF